MRNRPYVSKLTSPLKKCLQERESKDKDRCMMHTRFKVSMVESSGVKEQGESRGRDRGTEVHENHNVLHKLGATGLSME
jgi:hypothetical protein